MKSLLAALAFVLAAAPSFAAKPTLAYRGIALGDSLTEAIGTAQKQFEVVTPPGSFADDVVSFQAGEPVSLRRGSCPIAAHLDERRANCLRVSVGTRPVDGELKVHAITVQQSFRKLLVSGPEVLASIRAVYGEPVKSFASSYEKEDLQRGITSRTYLWGGSKIPPGPFEPDAAPFYDSVKVGGQFILLQLVEFGHYAVGYELRITDGERILKRHEVWQAERAAKTAKERKELKDQLKF